MSLPARSCAHRGCRRTTTDASGRCQDHRWSTSHEPHLIDTPMGGFRAVREDPWPAPVGRVHVMGPDKMPQLTYAAINGVSRAVRPTETDPWLYDAATPGVLENRMLSDAVEHWVSVRHRESPGRAKGFFRRDLARPVLSAADAFAWREATGMNAPHAAAWARWGMSAATANAWRAIGVDQDHVAAACRLNGGTAKTYPHALARAQARRWPRRRALNPWKDFAGFAAAEAGALAAGAQPDRGASAAMMVGGWEVADVVALRAAGVPVEVARAARERGARSGAALAQAFATAPTAP